MSELKSLSAMDDGGGSKKGRWPGFVHFFFLLAVVLCALVYAPRLWEVTSASGIDFFAPLTARPPSIDGAARGGDGGDSTDHAQSVPPSPTTTPIGRVVPPGQDGGDNAGHAVEVVLDNQVRSPCSSMRNHSICCDRSDYNTDVCFMAGDVGTDPASLSFLLFPPAPNATAEERVRPYTRKWERHLMKNIQEVRLRSARPEESSERRCDVRHDAPVFVMTAGGYTGNLFHAFNDGFLPVWLTVQHLRRRVVLAVLDYNPWWAGTFGEIVAGLSAHPVVDLLHDKRTHCFQGAIVGPRFHGLLVADPARTRDGKTLQDFNRFLADVYKHTDGAPRPQWAPPRRPRLGIYSRKGTRVIENEAAVARLAASVGFDVDVLRTATGRPLAAEHASVSACDVLMGVHGADLTKFLFLRPGAALLQIAPLGIVPIARDDFGRAALRMGLHYEQYDVRAHESSLARKYAADDVVVADPEEAKRSNGWDLVARVYLHGQNVSLDLARFGETLARLHSRALLLQ